MAPPTNTQPAASSGATYPAGTASSGFDQRGADADRRAQLRPVPDGVLDGEVDEGERPYDAPSPVEHVAAQQEAGGLVDVQPDVARRLLH